VVDKHKKLLAETRMVLPVEAGNQGLRQSKALFYHVKNLPGVMENLLTGLEKTKIKAVGVSTRPIPKDESYMPVFLAGTSLAECISSILGVPLVKTSHQEGHLAAGIWSSEGELDSDFLAFHLSGGTTELLRVHEKDNKPIRFDIKVLAYSHDIHAGQLVDRIGVAMNLPFPAGRHLEKLAAQKDGKTNIVIPSSVKGYEISFSGAETKAKNLLKQGLSHREIARAVENCIAISVEKAIRKAVEDTGLKKVLLVGGVAANMFIRQQLQRRLEHPAVGAKLYFPQVKYSSDNAVGVSLIARSILLP
jgi:N6-L-threonylcarbamoyladenine synthase